MKITLNCFLPFRMASGFHFLYSIWSLLLWLWHSLKILEHKTHTHTKLETNTIGMNRKCVMLKCTLFVIVSHLIGPKIELSELRMCVWVFWRFKFRKKLNISSSIPFRQFYSFFFHSHLMVFLFVSFSFRHRN